MRDERSSPWPGVNHGRTPLSQRGSTKPVFITSPVDHSWSKSMPIRLRDRRRVRRSRRRSPAATRSRLSSSASRSRPSAPSRITYLWCIRSGTPAIGLRRRPGAIAISCTSGSGRRRHWDRHARGRRCRRTVSARLVLRRAGIASPTIAAVSGPRLKSYWARSSVSLRPVEERRDEPRDLGRLLAAVRQSMDLDAIAHRQARRRPDRADDELLPGRRAAPLCDGSGSPRISRRGPAHPCCSSARRRATAGRACRGSRSPPSGSSPGSGPAEATATIVQRVLAELGLAEQVLLWNVVPTHPGTPTLEPAADARPRSAPGRAFADELARGRRVIARRARRARGARRRRTCAIPSHGGAAEFRARRCAGWSRREPGPPQRACCSHAGSSSSRG